METDLLVNLLLCCCVQDERDSGLQQLRESQRSIETLQFEREEVTSERDLVVEENKQLQLQLEAHVTSEKQLRHKNNELVSSVNEVRPHVVLCLENTKYLFSGSAQSRSRATQRIARHDVITTER